MSVTEYLQHSELFSGLASEQVERIVALGHEAVYNAGDAIIREGDPSDEMALVDRGARSATVCCVQDGTVLYVIARQAFWDLCDSDHHTGYVVMRNIAADLSFKLRHRNLKMRLAGGE
jgi:CRP-like cAMP-binding protein